MKKILILIIFFYFLTLFQTSFLVHFNFKGYVLNLVLVSIILINLFERTERNIGIFSAFFGGFFLDIFSDGFMRTSFIGFYILISLILAIFIKFILRKYVRIPTIERN